MPTISGKPALSPLQTEFKKEATLASTSGAAAPVEQPESFSQHPSPTKVLQKGRSGSRDWLNANTPESAEPGSASRAPSRKPSFVDFSKFSFGGRKNTNTSSTLLDSPSVLGDDSPQSAQSFLHRKSSAIWGRKASTYSHLESSQELGQSQLSLSRMSSSALSGEWMAGGEIVIGRKYCHSYQQWQEAALGEGQKQRQQAQATLRKELGEIYSLQEPLKEMADPMDVVDYLKGDYKNQVVRGLTPETREHVRKMDFIRRVVKPIIDAAESREKEGQVEEEGLQKDEHVSYVVENEMRVGSFNSHLRTSLLEKEMDDFIEQHKSAHDGAFPDAKSISRKIDSLLEETRKAATNENWMASLSSDLKKAAQSHLEKKKSQIPDGMEPLLATEHLDAQVDEMLNRILDTENPHQEATWEKFDKLFQDEMPVLVANAVTLPILFDRLDGFRQRQSEVEQRKAALDDSAKNRNNSKEQAPRYLSLVEDVASSILGKLQGANKKDDATGLIYTKDVDKNIRKRELIKNFRQVIQEEWRFEGVDENKARALAVRAETAATTYTGMMDVELKEKLLEAGKYDYAKKLEKTHDADGSAPTRYSIEVGIKKLHHKTTEEATDDWIQQIADELTIQCEKLAKGYNKARGGYSNSFGESSGSVTTYNLSVAVKILREEIPAAVRKIIQKMEREGVPFDAEDTLREFNDQFGKQRKKLVEEALAGSVDSEVKKSQLLTKGAKAIARQKSIPVIAAMPVAVTNMLVKTPYKKFEANSKEYAETRGIGEKTAMARVAGGAVGDAVVKGVPNLAKGAFKGTIRGVVNAVGAIGNIGKDQEEEEFLKLTEGLTEDERDFIGGFFGRTPRAGSA